MARILGALIALAAVGSLFLVREPEIVRLGALDAFAPERSLFGVEVEGTGKTLGELVLDDPALVPGEGQSATFQLDGVRIYSESEPTGDIKVHLTARRSVIRGLREIARDRGWSLDIDGELTRTQGGGNFLIQVERDFLRLEFLSPGFDPVSVRMDWAPPRRTSLLPPLIAILLAILIRKPVLALFFGVWSATFLMRRAGHSGAFESLTMSLPDVGSKLFWPKFVDSENAMIIGFVIAMLSMVGVMTKSGGIRGLMDLVSRLAGTVRSTQVSTYLMGLIVFFDDYANTILVGSTMRPLTDRVKIAREKLAYIVDSTSAPVAGLSIFSTWIAFEVSTFSAQLPAAGLSTADGYGVFIQSLPYRFYSILTLLFVPMIAFTGLDFGPMLKAERRARRTGLLVREGGKPMVGDTATRLQPAERVTPKALRAVLPLVMFLGLTLFEIARAGGAFEMSAGRLFTLQGLTDVLYNGSGSRPILIGSSAGLLVAVVLALFAGLRGEIWSAAWTTLRSMGVAVLILYLAWMIGLSCQNLGTATFLAELVGERLPPPLLPAILFLVAAAVAFSTGSSWGTMSILLPLVVGLAYSLGQDHGMGGHFLLVVSIGSVLEGSIFGDHCSPISDTTVLSSTATASDHIDHVRTQAPYAILTMLVALVFGYIPCVLLSWSPLFTIVVSAILLFLILRLVGRRSDEPSPQPPSPA